MSMSRPTARSLPALPLILACAIACTLATAMALAIANPHERAYASDSQSTPTTLFTTSSLRSASDGELVDGLLTVLGASSPDTLVQEFGMRKNIALQVFAARPDPQGDYAGPITIISSDPSVLKVPDEYAYVVPSDPSYYHPTEYYLQPILDIVGAGTATITITYASNSISIPFAFYPYDTELTSAKKASYNTAKLTWKATKGASGYVLVYSTGDPYDKSTYTTLKTIPKATTTSAIVKCKWGVKYHFRIAPYMTYQGKRLMTEFPYCYPMSFTLEAPSAKLTSVKAQSGTSLKASWKADSGANKFLVYRSAYQDRGYKLIGTTAKSYFVDRKVKKGQTYYYRVTAVYPDAGSITSNSLCQMLPKKSQFLAKTLPNVAHEESMGSYGKPSMNLNWALSDKVFYYSQGGKIYLVSYSNKTLRVYGFTTGWKKISTKTVKLPGHNLWGGFYHGPDQNNYVVIGLKDPYDFRDKNYIAKEKKRVVMKIVKFNKSWKKLKTVSIKGGDVEYGILEPFSADGRGPVAMDMYGTRMYLLTARGMFSGHEADVAFNIDTKTMKVEQDTKPYVSHSFNQRVKFKDGLVFSAEHGDAYPRSLVFRAETGAEDGKLTLGWPLRFMGEAGDNQTYAKLGGFEVGASSVIMSGTSQPHYHSIAGVKGFDFMYRQNVFVTSTSLSTGKTKFRWLTSINPKDRSKVVSEVRTVKIADNRFAVLYTISNYKTRTTTMYYKAVDGSGKPVLTRTYKNAIFTGSSQPILVNGSIYWSEKYGGNTVKGYRIPAL